MSPNDPPRHGIHASRWKKAVAGLWSAAKGILMLIGAVHLFRSLVKLWEAL